MTLTAGEIRPDIAMGCWNKLRRAEPPAPGWQGPCRRRVRCAARRYVQLILSPAIACKPSQAGVAVSGGRYQIRFRQFSATCGNAAEQLSDWNNLPISRRA